MITPRDSPPPLAVAINYETGFPITDNQKIHLAAIAEAGERLLQAMHDAEGSSAGDNFQMRRMVTAHTHIETALMFARRAALEVR